MVQANHETLVASSVKVLEFARSHCYEREFTKRIEALNATLAASAARPACVSDWRS
jgi:hypothetical protein